VGVQMRILTSRRRRGGDCVYGALEKVSVCVYVHVTVCLCVCVCVCVCVDANPTR